VNFCWGQLIEERQCHDALGNGIAMAASTSARAHKKRRASARLEREFA